MNNSHRGLKSSTCLIVMIFLILSITYCHAQITVQMSDMEKIFTPGKYIAVNIAPINSVDIGQTGGSHIYDFSTISYTDTNTFYVDSLSTIPELIGRYPSTAFIWGGHPEVGGGNKVVMELVNNTMLGYGSVSIFPETQNYNHDIPPEQAVIFPANYSLSWDYSLTTYDTTIVNGVVTETESHERYVTTIIDGYGTLKIPGYEFECLRMKRNHAIPLPEDKEYWYMTQEGVLLIINGGAVEPDTGVVQIESAILFIGESFISSVPESSKLPENFSLNQNYPNPFNPSTTIEFTLPKSEFVKLKIYNILGKEVSTLVSNKLNQGNHTYTFDGKNLASGIYYYHLVAGEYSEVKKMILLR